MGQCRLVEKPIDIPDLGDDTGGIDRADTTDGSQGIRDQFHLRCNGLGVVFDLRIQRSHTLNTARAVALKEAENTFYCVKVELEQAVQKALLLLNEVLNREVSGSCKIMEGFVAVVIQVHLFDDSAEVQAICKKMRFTSFLDSSRELGPEKLLCLEPSGFMR